MQDSQDVHPTQYTHSFEGNKNVGKSKKLRVNAKNKTKVKEFCTYNLDCNQNKPAPKITTAIKSKGSKFLSYQSNFSNADETITNLLVNKTFETRPHLKL